MRPSDLANIFRQQGSSSALIAIMLANPNARMVVLNHQMAQTMALRYGVDIKRFVSASNLANGLIGWSSGPLLIDVSAIPALIEEEAKELAEEKLTKSYLLDEAKKEGWLRCAKYLDSRYAYEIGLGLRQEMMRDANKQSEVQFPTAKKYPLQEITESRSRP